MRQIAENAGEDGAVVSGKVLDNDEYNELRVCAARSRRRSPVGRTRFVGRRSSANGDFTRDVWWRGGQVCLGGREVSGTTAASRSMKAVSGWSASSFGSR
jgi:hypothetical protein